MDCFQSRLSDGFRLVLINNWQGTVHPAQIKKFTITFLRFCFMDKAVTIIISWTLRSLPHAMVHHVSDFWKPWRTGSAYTSAHDFLGRTCLVLYKFELNSSQFGRRLTRAAPVVGILKKSYLLYFHRFLAPGPLEQII